MKKFLIALLFLSMFGSAIVSAKTWEGHFNKSTGKIFDVNTPCPTAVFNWDPDLAAAFGHVLITETDGSAAEINILTVPSDFALSTPTQTTTPNIVSITTQTINTPMPSFTPTTTPTFTAIQAHL